MRTIAAIAAGLLLVGCGLQTGTTGGHKSSPSASATTPAAPVTRHVNCVHLKATPGQSTISLTNVNNHGSFCVPRGSGLFVFLHASTPVLWTPIQSSSAVLAHRPSGRLSLMAGETGAFFVAAEAGTAKVTSFEPRCPGGPHPRVHRSGRCPAPLRFAVTVHVLR